MEYKVSIIIPIYNVEPYIMECLQSVGNQTYQNGLECILVDDCGTDGSVLITEQFLNTYRGHIHFELIHHNRNKGLSAARNTGIRASHGEYLYFLDSDDTIIPNCIELLLDLGTKYKADLVIGLYETRDDRMRQFDGIDYPEIVSDRKQVKRMLLDYDVIPVTAANRLILKELILRRDLFFKEGIIHEDNHWTFFLAKYVERMAICKEKVYYYRPTIGSIMNYKNVEKEIFSFKAIIEDFCANIDSFEKGAQKRLILCLLLIVVNSGYYTSEKEKQGLVSCFSAKNNLFQKIILFFVFQLKKSFMQNKLICLLMKIYN